MRLQLLTKLLGLLCSGTLYAAPVLTHGMLLFGNEESYISHLPMLHGPHAFQLLMQVELEDLPMSETLGIYQEAKRAGSTVFTLVPQPFDVDKVLDGTIATLTAQLYDGHFEKGGLALGQVLVNLKRKLHHATLPDSIGNSNYPTYLVFGEGNEFYGLHIIRNFPSFDAVVAVERPMVWREEQCQRRVCGFHIPGDKIIPTPLIFTAKTQNEPPQTGDLLVRGHILANGGYTTSITHVILCERDGLEWHQ